MNPEEQQLNEFLEWFGQIDSIPLKVRRDFFSHLKDIGGIDLKAYEFIESTLNRLATTNENEIESLKDKWTLVSATLQVQAEPQFSLKEKIFHYAKQTMFGRAAKFNKTFAATSQVDLQEEEQDQDELEAAEVMALKASL